MVLLVHHSISPQSRKVRLIMAEKENAFCLKRRRAMETFAGHIGYKSFGRFARVGF